MPPTVWTVRHGQRQDSDPGWAETAERVHDPGLTDHGRWEAWRVGRRLAETGLDPDAVYASPFLRCVETADEICAELDCTFALEPGLGEHRNDEWFDADPELLDVAALCERFDRCTGVDDAIVHPEFPESHEVAQRRVAETTRELADRNSGDDHLLLVGHGLTIGGVVRGLVGSTEHVDAPLAGLTRVEWREGAADGNEATGTATDGDEANGDETEGAWHLCYSGDVLHLQVEA